MDLYNKIKDFFTAGIRKLQAAATDHDRHMLESEKAQEMVNLEMEHYGMTRDQAEQAVVALLYARDVAMGMVGSAAAKDASAIGRKAFRKSYNPKLGVKLGRKALAKIDELEKKFKFNVKSNPQTWPHALWEWLKKNPMPIALIVASMDTPFWAPKMLSDGLKNLGFGNWFRERQQTEIGKQYTHHQLEDLAENLKKQGYTTLFEFNTNEPLDLTGTNLWHLAEEARGQILTEGRIPSQKEILRKIVARAGKGTTYKPPTTGETERLVTLAPISLEISGVQIANVTITPLAYTQLTDPNDLRKAIKDEIQNFINTIPYRLYFDIVLSKVFVRPDGHVITPSPPTFVMTEMTKTGEKKRVMQNKIVILRVSIITWQGKKVQVFQKPLDYSIADSAITEQPTVPTQPIQLVVGGEEVSVPETPAPAPAPSPAPAPAPAPAPSPAPAPAPSPAPSPAPAPAPAPAPSPAPAPAPSPAPAPAPPAPTKPVWPQIFPFKVEMGSHRFLKYTHPFVHGTHSGYQLEHTNFLAQKIVTGEYVDGSNLWWKLERLGHTYYIPLKKTLTGNLLLGSYIVNPT